MISRDVIEAIRERTDIVQVISQTVTLQRKGNTYLGLCPFHQERSPSFNVVPAKGIYHCFGCGEGGDIFKFMEKTRGLSFHEVLKELGPAVGVQIEDRELAPEEARKLRARADLFEVNTLAAEFFHKNLLARAEGKAALDYLRKRGLTDDTIQRYQLGFSLDAWDGLLIELHKRGVPPEMAVSAGLARRREGGRTGLYDLFRGRVMVPIQDARGRTVAFGGRVMPGAPAGPDGREAPKYVNSPETEIYKKSSLLYALPQARAEVQRKGWMIVVEGYFDVLALHQAGFKEAVATCGTALTPEHVAIIQPLTRDVVAQFDSDEAGVRAALRSFEAFLKLEIEPRRLSLGEAKDPDEFLQKHGADELTAMLRRAPGLFELALDRSRVRHGYGDRSIDLVVGDLAPLIRMYPPTLRSARENRLAAAFGVPEAVVRERIGASQQNPNPAGTAPPRRWAPPAELKHLLWLLIHHTAQVAPLLALVPDPRQLSDRESVLQAMALLLNGAPFPTVLEEVKDADLVHLLRGAAAHEGLYTAEKAGAAARQVLDRIRLNRIEEELALVDRQSRALSGVGGGNTPAPGDSPARGAAPDELSRYRELLARRQQLQRERAALKSRSNATG